MALPPGVSERNFQRAIKRFEAVVGAEWVFTSDEDIALYRDAYSPLVGEAEGFIRVRRGGAYTHREDRGRSGDRSSRYRAGRGGSTGFRPAASLVVDPVDR